MNPARDTLIAALHSEADLETAASRGWMILPLSGGRLPEIVRSGRLRYVAFYHGSLFSSTPFTVGEYAKATDVQVVCRKECLPLPGNEKQEALFRTRAEQEVLRISFSGLTVLDNPIVSNKERHFSYIETTHEKLRQATELNELFYETVAEETLWNEFRKRKIAAERRYPVQLRQGRLILDFAIFCKYGRINVECKGEYFDEAAGGPSDAERSHLLHSRGWTVVAVTPDDVFYDTEDVMILITDLIERFGGLEESLTVAGLRLPGFVQL